MIQELVDYCDANFGPCSELIAIEEYRKGYGLTFEYKYTGFDINSVWERIQSRVASLSATPDSIKFVYGDVFDYYEHTNERPNMIILNYMLSDMLKYNQTDFPAFIENLCNFVAGLPSCALLINDINRGVNENDPRWYYSVIYNKIVEQCGNTNIEHRCYHFEDSMKKFFPYGDKRGNNGILIKVPDKIIYKYTTNTECHSAQILIIKK